MKIKVGATELTVKNFYPFRYPDGKLVLRFDVRQVDADFTALYSLLNGNQEPIAYYEKDEDEKPQCIYYGYSDFTANYTHGTYSVEQITPSTLGSAVEALQAKSEEQAAIISEQLLTIEQQTAAINNQALMIDSLTECLLEMSTEVYANSLETEEPENSEV